MSGKLFALTQYVLPHHLISRATHWAASCKAPWFKDRLIRWFIKQYDVDLSEAKITTPEGFEDFNDFFTRYLVDGARPLPQDKSAIISPADGAISQIGDIEYGRIFQAKGHQFSLTELLGGDSTLADQFMGGKFATIYLSPKDYHRVHMPASGKLKEMIHVPGRLFSVNKSTTENVPNLFARNERVVSIFETEHGPMAVILVGAMIVASIETSWAGLVTPQRRRVRRTDYSQDGLKPVNIERGGEVGAFKLGSTAIVLFPKDTMKWNDTICADSPMRMGQVIGDFTAH